MSLIIILYSMPVVRKTNICTVVAGSLLLKYNNETNIYNIIVSEIVEINE